MTVRDGDINFTAPLSITADNKLIVPVGMEASVTLALEQKRITDESPDDNGIDAKEASIKLPKTFSFSINHTGKAITAVDSKWNLYGQAINFTFDNTKPMRWVPELNRIAIPYKTDVTELEIAQCKKPGMYHLWQSTCCRCRLGIICNGNQYKCAIRSRWNWCYGCKCGRRFGGKLVGAQRYQPV